MTLVVTLVLAVFASFFPPLIVTFNSAGMVVNGLPKRSNTSYDAMPLA